jgi:hypothetical protein
VSDQAVSKAIVFSVDEAPEGGYTAYALGFSIVTEADTWEELKEMVRAAVRCAFDEGQAPPAVRLHLVRDQVIAACNAEKRFGRRAGEATRSARLSDISPERQSQEADDHRA